LATKNFRSISTGLRCSCSFGRSDFSRTDRYRVDGTRGCRPESINRSMAPIGKPGQMPTTVVRPRSNSGSRLTLPRAHNCSSNALASFKSRVSKPSVNQP
jgi:hypothetical protein